MKHAAHKTNLALAAITITLALTLYATYQRPQQTDTEHILLPELLQPAPDYVRMMDGVKGSTVTIFYDGADWRLDTHDVFPILPADRLRVENLLFTLASLTAQKVDVANGDDTLYIQEPARFIVQIDNKQLAIGKNNPIDYRRYVKYDGNIFLTRDELVPILGSQKLFFAAHNLLPDDFYPVAITRGEQYIDFAFLGDSGTNTRIAWQQARSLLLQYDDRPIPDGADFLHIHDHEGDNIVFVVIAIKPTPTLLRPDLYISYQLSQQLWQELLPDVLVTNDEG